MHQASTAAQPFDPTAVLPTLSARYDPLRTERAMKKRAMMSVHVMKNMLRPQLAYGA